MVPTTTGSLDSPTTGALPDTSNTTHGPSSVEPISVRSAEARAWLTASEEKAM